MTNRTRRDPRQLQREKLLFRYTGALERGDFQIVAGVLQEAERDPVLAAMLRELDDELAAELPVLRPSSNHRHPVKETNPMVSSYPTRPLARPRPAYPYTLAAAVLVVALFAGMLLFNRPINPMQDSTAAAVAQGGTASPTHTQTPLPSIPPPTAFHSVSPVPAEVIPQVVLCEGLVNRGDGANLFIAPDANAQLITRLPMGASLQIVNQESLMAGASGVFWVEVNAQLETGSLVGWLQGENIALLTSCPAVNVAFLPTPVSPVEINVEGNEQYVLREGLGGIPAGTPVNILSGYYDGIQWRYEIESPQGRLDHVGFDQLLWLVDEWPVEFVSGCQFTIGNGQAGIYNAPDSASQLVVAIDPGSEVNGNIIIGIDMPNGERWLLVSLDSTPPVSGWINRDDLLNGQITCSPMMSNAFMLPPEFSAMPMMPPEMGSLAAPQMWPSTLPPEPVQIIIVTATHLPNETVSATHTATATPTATWTHTPTMTPIP